MGYSAPTEQLPLPYPDSMLFVFALVAHMNYRDFAELLIGSMASWVIDFRIVPRFDILADSRAMAFDLFEERRIKYVDWFGYIEIESYHSVDYNPAIWGDKLCKLLRKWKSKREGPYVFLFEDRALLKSADEILPGMLRTEFGDEVRFHKVLCPKLNNQDLRER